jgi:hypothetical protein
MNRHHLNYLSTDIICTNNIPTSKYFLFEHSRKITKIKQIFLGKFYQK